MVVLSAQVLQNALDSTSQIMNDDVRRRKMRGWLQAQGYSAATINASDEAIHSAIRFSRMGASKVKQNTKIAKTKTPNSYTNNLNDTEILVKLAWLIVVMLSCVAFSSISAFLLAPGLATDRQLVNIGVTSILGSTVIAMVSAVIWFQTRFFGWRMLAALMTLGAIPAFMLGSAIDASSEATGHAQLPTVYSERGAVAIFNTAARMFASSGDDADAPSASKTATNSVENVIDLTIASAGSADNSYEAAIRLLGQPKFSCYRLKSAVLSLDQNIVGRDFSHRTEMRVLHDRNRDGYIRGQGDARYIDRLEYFEGFFPSHCDGSLLYVPVTRIDVFRDEFTKSCAELSTLEYAHEHQSLDVLQRRFEDRKPGALAWTAHASQCSFDKSWAQMERIR